MSLNEARRVQELNEMGFVWLLGKRLSLELKGRTRLTWEERFQQLVAFKERHCHCLVKQHSSDGLGEWVKQVRIETSPSNARVD